MLKRARNLLSIEWFRISLIFLAALFIFSLKIGSIQIIDGDTGFYATISKNIVQSGDWLTLKFLSPSDIIDKPPLFMWLSAISFIVFGINEFALSFWHSILAAGAVVLTYLMGRDLFSKRIGMISAAVLLTTSMFFYLGRTPLQDMPITFFILLSLYAFAKYDATRALPFFYLSSIACALGVMMKGPMGLAVPAVVILAYLIINRRGMFNKPYQYFIHLPLGIALFLSIIAPWFIAEYLILGQKFADIFILRNFGRYLHPTDALPGAQMIPQWDFYSYFFQVLLLCAPWSGFVYPAIYYAVKKREGDRKKILFTLIYALGGIVFFSASLNYKISRYVLPAFPPLAILVGVLISDALDKKSALAEKLLRISSRINLYLITPLLAIATIWLFVKFPAAQSGYQPIMLPFLAIFTATLLISSILMLRKPDIGLKIGVAGTYISFMAFIICAALFFSNADPVKDYSLRLKDAISSGGAGVKYMGEAPRNEYFYAGTELQYITRSDELLRLIRSGIKVMGMATDINDLKTFEKTYRLKLDILDSRGGYILWEAK